MSARADLILGTAGHIDHGKSALVQALTGTDPDRLAEEKQRGITIKLGFAQLQLPSGRTMGVVDVPGHERFVRQMIAGATGVDLALLVIAADDGIMPQTVEHVAVLQTLGVRSCVVALAKADLVDEEWTGFVAEEVRGFLASTPYADAPIVPVSSKTGFGLDDLLRAIEDVASALGGVHRTGAARLPVDRVFTIKGAGTVVTGTLWGGTVGAGDELQALPHAARYRVRSVQVHNSAVERAQAGNRVALNLADASRDDVSAGDFLCAPGAVALTDRFDCELTFLDTAKRNKPLETGTRMHVAHGTREVLGRVLLCNGKKRLQPGESAYAQIRLEEELPVSTADRFVVRTYSPVAVAGGGTVLLAHPRRRTNLDETAIALLDSLKARDYARAVELAVSSQRLPATAEQVARFIGDDEADVRALLERAAAGKGPVLSLGGAGAGAFYATKPLLARLASAVDKALVVFHGENPASAGMPKDALRRKCFPNMGMACFDAVLADLSASGSVVVRGGLVGHPAAQGSADRIVENAADALLEVLRAEALSPETMPYIAKRAGLDAKLAAQAMGVLVESGRACKLGPDLFFCAEAVDAARDAVVSHLRAGGAGNASALKDAMGTTRKFAVPLLEYFDAEGTTIREGDSRACR